MIQDTIFFRNSVEADSFICDIVEVMSLLDMVVSESTESIQVVVVWPVVNIITEPTLTSTILVTSYVLLVLVSFG